MRNHGKDSKDEQPAGPRRPRLPSLAKADADKDELQALVAYAYLQTQNLRKQAVEELKQDADAISAVIETQHALAVSDFDLQGKLEYTIEQARKITNAGGAVIALAEGEQIVCRARTGLIGPPLGSCLDPHSGISGECIRSGELLYCDDTETDPRVNLAACRQLGIRSILALPLILHEQTLGLVEIFSGWAGVFGDRDIRTMKMLAGQIIEALWEEETPIIAAHSQPTAVIEVEEDEAEAEEDEPEAEEICQVNEA
ncbi:MAG: GAF domain-containing protein, partial [Acidobacteria bacterium]|nr:GAF domain-containing protein [Acidobacteriota bacterium]